MALQTHGYLEPERQVEANSAKFKEIVTNRVNHTIDSARGTRGTFEMGKGYRV